ncbi:hypothetical protein HME9302_00160 [Alteripontixanthobacter maritimus]|uniref:Uncharacterized protein n=1 Tax=Alteripontixanthobacter maritimus TaxID=2161824 RepID=A0A369Q257_9SPHN|nr:hypothetical protein [Alteripontixanthobacter maritimus]RDC58983.1 hypothetical protein HME9302_00160 [Alteripontixanthobacter maritimus]
MGYVGYIALGISFLALGLIFRKQGIGGKLAWVLFVLAGGLFLVAALGNAGLF